MIRQNFFIVMNSHNLGMPGATRAYRLIGRIRDLATSIATLDFTNSF